MMCVHVVSVGNQKVPVQRVGAGTVAAALRLWVFNEGGDGQSIDGLVVVCVDMGWIGEQCEARA